MSLAASAPRLFAQLQIVLTPEIQLLNDSLIHRAMLTLLLLNADLGMEKFGFISPKTWNKIFLAANEEEKVYGTISADLVTCEARQNQLKCVTYGV